MWRILKTGAWVGMPLLLYSYVVTFITTLLGQTSFTVNTQVFGGCVVAGILAWTVLRNKLMFFHVFDHELTHLIVGLFFFIRPHVFVASEKSGMVGLARNNFIVVLAPYCFPLFSYVLLPLSSLLRVEYLLYFHGLLGLATGYHVISKIQDFHARQSDIMKEGYVFSLIFCLLCATISFGIIVLFVFGGSHLSLEFLKGGITRLLSDGHLVLQQSVRFVSTLT